MPKAKKSENISGDKMQIVEIEISKLNHAGYNPRSITDSQMDKLVKSISHYGFVEPVVINKDYTIIGGHQRVKAFQILERASVPCVIVDLDKQNEKALNIALNKTGGEFDADMLQSLLTELKLDDFDLELTGFNLDIQLQNTNLSDIEETIKTTNEIMESLSRKPKHENIDKSESGDISILMVGPLNDDDFKKLKSEYYGRGIKVEVLA